MQTGWHVTMPPGLHHAQDAGDQSAASAICLRAMV
jgi:hypothetical protein